MQSCIALRAPPHGALHGRASALLCARPATRLGPSSYSSSLQGAQGQARPSLRSLHTSRAVEQEAAPPLARPPPPKPIGAFRGTLFGFLLGSTLAGAGLFYYVLDEYKLANQLLTEDILILQGTALRVEDYLISLEQRVEHLERRRKRRTEARRNSASSTSSDSSSVQVQTPASEES